MKMLSLVLVSFALLQSGCLSQEAAADQQNGEQQQCVEQEEFQRVLRRLSTVEQEVNTWQNATIHVIRRYLLDNPSLLVENVERELHHIQDKLQLLQLMQEQQKDRTEDNQQKVKDKLEQVEEGLGNCSTKLERVQLHESLATLLMAHNVTLNQVQRLVNQSTCSQTQFPLGSFQNSATSCRQIVEEYGGSTSGNYWIQSSSGTKSYIYCDMARHCCGSTGGWMRVAYLDTTDPSQQCPPGFRLITNPQRLCKRASAPGCTSITAVTHGVQYSKVCGRVVGFQDYTTDAFAEYYHDRSVTIDNPYVDGVSITHGQSPKKHIWTFASVYSETRTDVATCPCTKTDTTYTGVVPPFIGNDYFCDSSVRSGRPQSRIYTEDPLWDGSGCGPTSSCCTFNSPPWFCKQLPQPTTDDVEVRVCTNQGFSDEDVLIEQIELYVQ